MLLHLLELGRDFDACSLYFFWPRVVNHPEALFRLMDHCQCVTDSILSIQAAADSFDIRIV